MSRYTRQLGSGLELAFGWDAPLGSFFAQIFDHNAECEEDYLVVDIGCGLEQLEDGTYIENSVRDASKLARLLYEQAGEQLTQEDIDELESDKEERGYEVTAFQLLQQLSFDAIAGIKRLDRSDDV